MSNNTGTNKKKWRRYLAKEITEIRVYQILAQRHTGEKKQIFLDLAEAEERHAQYWRNLLGDKHDPKPRDFFLRLIAKYGNKVLALSLLQRAEAKTPYCKDPDANPVMAADETIHKEVLRAIASEGRQNISGAFRAAIFGINDGLVSNTALLMSMVVFSPRLDLVLVAGFSGLLSGALSMAAGEYVSVKSQKELLDVSLPDANSQQALPKLCIEANELALVYRAQGYDSHRANQRAQRVLEIVQKNTNIEDCEDYEEVNLGHEIKIDNQTIGSPWSAAIASFMLFAGGAFVPILPYLFGWPDVAALWGAIILFGLALLATGALIGILSGTGLLWRAVRQLLIGGSATAITCIVGAIFGHNIS